MTLTLPDAPNASFDRLLEVSSILKTLNEDRTAYAEQFVSNYSVSGWTAINSQPVNPVSSSVGIEKACSTPDIEAETAAEEVYSGGERDVLFTFEADQAFAYDTETGVYMKNVQVGSWAGRFCDDETTDTEIRKMVALNHVRRAQKSSNAQQRTAEGQTTESENTTNASSHSANRTTRSYPNDGQTKKPRGALEIDEAARVVISAIKFVLIEGGTLTLEHTGAQEAYKHSCCACATYISTDTYMVGVTVEAPDYYTYCLTCFEGLWNGEMQVGTLLDPRIVIKGSNVKMAETEKCTCHGDLDDLLHLRESCTTTKMDTFGAGFWAEDQTPLSKVQSLTERPIIERSETKMSGALLDSKHAPNPPEIAISQLANNVGFAKKHHNEDPQPMLSALRSTLPPESIAIVGNGHCGRFSPTRFQHLAPHIEAGGSLNEVEKAALSVWKATTKDQFRCMSRFLAGSMDKKIETEVHRENSDVDDALNMDGLDKVKFHGRDLSEVLIMAAARDDI